MKKKLFSRIWEGIKNTWKYGREKLFGRGAKTAGGGISAGGASSKAVKDSEALIKTSGAASKALTLPSSRMAMKGAGPGIKLSFGALGGGAAKRWLSSAFARLKSFGARFRTKLGVLKYNLSAAGARVAAGWRRLPKWARRTIVGTAAGAGIGWALYKLFTSKGEDEDQTVFVPDGGGDDDRAIDYYDDTPVPPNTAIAEELSRSISSYLFAVNTYLNGNGSHAKPYPIELALARVGSNMRDLTLSASPDVAVKYLYGLIAAMELGMTEDFDESAGSLRRMHSLLSGMNSVAVALDRSDTLITLSMISTEDTWSDYTYAEG